MKKVEFLIQGLENFCNHIEPLEIDFTNGSITMITGPNGIGKTSIFQSIPFTLYGQCEKGRGDDVLNSKTGKNCHTWTIFSIDGIKYRVDRYVKYTRIGNSVTITKGDDTEPYLKGHKEVVPEIEKLLMPYKLFINTLLFSQKVKSFFTDLGDAEQKEIFRKILTLDDFVLYMQECGFEIKEIEKIINELNQEIGINKGLLESSEKRLQKSLNDEELFNKNAEQKVFDSNIQVQLFEEKILLHLEKQKELPEDTLKQQQELSNKKSVLENNLSNLDNIEDNEINNVDNQANLKISEIEKKSLEMSNESSKTMRDSVQQEKDKYNIILEKQSKEIYAITEKKRKIDLDSTKLTSNIDFLKTEINNLNIGDISICPTCQRKIDHKCIKHLGELADGKVNEMFELQQQIKELVEEYKKLDEEEASINLLNEKDRLECLDTIKNIEEKNRITLAQYVERKNIAINKVKELIKQTKIDIQQSSIEKSKNIKKEISELENQLSKLEEIQKTIDKYNKDLTDLQSDLDESKKELKEAKELEFDKSPIVSCSHEIEKYKKVIKESLDERIKHDKRIEIIKFWKVGFSSSGIQSMLIDEAIPFMNNRISHYMDMLCNGRYKVTFDTLKATKGNKEFRDKISVEVFDTLTHSDKRVKFSGGQTRLVDIGTILTLADLMSNVQDVSFNIILFDEIFDSLDSENIRYASNLLRMASKEKWVGIISHVKIDDLDPDNVLEFR